MITRRRLFKLAGGAAALAATPKPLLSLIPEAAPVQVLNKEQLNILFGSMTTPNYIDHAYYLYGICRAPGETDQQLRERFRLFNER